MEEPPPKEVMEVTDKGWRDGYIRKWLSVILGRRAWMLQKHQRQGKAVQRLEDLAATGSYPDKQGGDDDVGVNVGDVTHHHYPAEKKGNPITTFALAAAALVGTGGVSAFVGYLPRGDDMQRATDTDTWREFDLTPGDVTDIP